MDSSVPVARRILTAAAMASAALLAACASTPPPDAEIAQSAAAINAAVSAGAADVAPAELRAAREKLDLARMQRESNHNKGALALAREAGTDARLAESKALAAKSQKSAADLQEANRVLAEEINRKSSSTTR